MKLLSFLTRLTAIATVAVVTNTALADDDRAACFDAAEKGQALRVGHRLVEARDQFRVCAAQTCPGTVRGDCLRWLDQVDKAIPTVVLAAKDPSGNDVLDVTVTVDGAPFAAKLEGVSLPIDPGPHTFRFVWPDGTAKERQVLVPEGQTGLAVAVSLAPVGGTEAQRPVVVLPPPPHPPPSPSGTSWRTVGWIAGGVGVAGLAVGGIFTGITVSDKGAADCNATTKTCAHYDSIHSAMSVAPVAGTGFIAGAALVATGALLVLLVHPAKEGRSVGGRTTRVGLAPIVGPAGAGALLQGSW